MHKHTDCTNRAKHTYIDYVLGGVGVCEWKLEASERNQQNPERSQQTPERSQLKTRAEASRAQRKPAEPRIRDSSDSSQKARIRGIKSPMAKESLVIPKVGMPALDLRARSECRPWTSEQGRNAGLGSVSKAGIPALLIRPCPTSLLQSCAEYSPGSCPQRMVTLASNASTRQCLAAATCGCQNVVCIGLVDVCT